MAYAMHALAARYQSVALLGRIVAADRRARLHEGTGGALIANGALDDEIGVRDGGVDLSAATELMVERHIPRCTRPQYWRIIRKRRQHIGDRGQNLIFHLDRFRGIAGGKNALGHDDGDGFADIANATHRERPLALIENLALG